MPSEPTSYPLPAQHFLNAAMRLAAELDEAQLYRAAAYASMVADAIRRGAEPAKEEDRHTDVGLDFELDEHDRVWMVREGDCYILGRSNPVCAQMRRFLATVLPSDKL